MKTNTTITLSVLAVALLGAVGYGAWTAGMRAGMDMGRAQPAPGAPSTARTPMGGPWHRAGSHRTPPPRRAKGR